MKRLLLFLAFPIFPLGGFAQQPPAVAAPEISISANGSNNATVYQGWPLIVSLSILNSTRLQGASATPLVIAPQTGNWTDAIQFTAVSSSGSSFQWPLKLVGSPASPSLTLQRSSYVRAVWQVSPADTLTLPSDTYQLTATLQVANSTGWNGVAASSPVTVQIGPEPSSPTQEQQLEKALVISQFQTNSGNLDSALTTVQQYLNSNPNDSAALSASANLLELQGYPGVGFFQARDALNAFYQANPTPTEAPSNLLSMYQRLFTYMTTPNSSAASTSMIAVNVSTNYSPTDQTVTLSVTVTSPSASVNEGTVVFKVLGVGNPVSVTSVQSSATANFTIPGGTPVASYPIEVSYSGTPNFSPSSASSQLTIAAVPLTIAANNATREYSQPNPPFSVSYSGLPAGSPTAALTGTLTCATAATAGSSVGSYPIMCSGLTSSNYAITFVPGTLTVTPDSLIVTATSATRRYALPNPRFTATFAGFVNGDTAASLGGTLACTTSATAATSVGAYPINCSGLSSANYSITYVSGALTITPAPLTVAANDATRPYGSNNPVFTGAISGLLNGDSITATLASLASPASPVGTYAVVPAAVGAPSVLGNYAIQLVNGSLAVTPDTTSLTVAFASASIPVGQSTTATITLTAPGMVIPIDPSVLAPITVTSPIVSDILSNSGVCTPVPSATPGIASCTIAVTSVEPNGRTLTANFAGSPNLASSSATADLIVIAALKSQNACIKSDFRNVAVAGGNSIWFNSIFKVRDLDGPTQKVNISFFNSSFQFQYKDANGNLISVNQSMPDAHIVIDPSVSVASTSFDSVNNVWITTIPWDLDDNAFLTGMSWAVPPGGLPADVEPVTVCGTFASDVADIDIGWRWAAAAYSSFDTGNSTLGVKPMDSDHDNPASNHDRAGTPENYKQFVIPGARGKGGRNYTGSYSGGAQIE
ncbi:MAG TPA: MBG domain-containing protein [Terriglobales bacterium]|jgi:hypothetical protein|nr:MBG domain-containing protein [Terriglobales bacterium]